MKRNMCLAVVVVSLVMCAFGTSATVIYWCNGDYGLKAIAGTVRSLDLNSAGTLGPSTPVADWNTTQTAYPRGIDLAWLITRDLPVSPVLFWGCFWDDTICAYALGSSTLPATQCVVEGYGAYHSRVAGPQDIAVAYDSALGRFYLYWTNIDDTIRRCPIEAVPQPATIIADWRSGVSDPAGLEVVGNRVYWVNRGDMTIRYCPVADSPQASFPVTDDKSGLIDVWDIKIAEGWVYWADSQRNVILRGPIPTRPGDVLQAKDISEVANASISEVSRPFGLWLSAPRIAESVPADIYWTNWGDQTIRVARVPAVGEDPKISAKVADGPNSQVHNPTYLTVREDTYSIELILRHMTQDSEGVSGGATSE
jgi:hypothetical protein